MGSQEENRERVEAPSNVVNINTDSLTQMMTAMTQLIQDARAHPVREMTNVNTVDKYLKLFQDMRPPLFKGTEGPVEAENWLMRIEKIFNGMSCPEERRVPLATFVLDGEAERWWRGQNQEKFDGLPSSEIKWEWFVEVFRDWFVPLSARRQMQDKFMRLVQGDRTVMQYEAEFTTLARYAPQLIHTAEEKCHRFLTGLRDAIRQPLVPLGIEDYSVLVERARRVEIDLQTTQRRHEFQKRKNSESRRETQNSQFKQASYSGGSNWKKGRSNDRGSQISTSQCERCGKQHRGECLSGTNTCFRCHRPGHMARDCPTMGQNHSGDFKSSTTPSQRNYGKQRVTESSASAHNQVR